MLTTIGKLHVDRIEVASSWEGVSYIRILSTARVKSCELTQAMQYKICNKYGKLQV